MRRQRGLQRLWALTGALAVVLFGCGLLFGDLLGSSRYPALNAPARQVRGYFLDNGTDVRALGFFHVLASLALLGFALYLYRHLGEAARVAAAATALSGGAVAAAFLLLSALCYRTLAEPVVARDDALTHALLVMSYLAGGPAIAAPLGLTIAAGTAAALRPNALGPNALGPNALGPNALGPNALGPNALGPNALGPNALGPNALGPNALGPNALGPNALGPNALGPNALGPNALGPNALGPNALPRWSGWLGIPAAVCSVLSAGVLLGPMNNSSGWYGVLLLAAVLGFGWTFLVSIALALRPREDHAIRS